MPVRAEAPFEGDKPYQVRARQAFPRLVRLAQTGTVWSYSELAAELSLPNPRNCDYVLASVVEALNQYSQATGQPLPRLTSVIVNQATGLPGDGLMSTVISADQLRNMDPQEKKRLARLVLESVFSFRQWDCVLEHFGLAPLAVPTLPAPVFQTREGESAEHRALKEFVASNPAAAGVPSQMKPEMESILYSGDRVDVLFRSNKRIVAVEVKTAFASPAELMRGIFQCVKYEAVLQAQQRIASAGFRVSAQLVIGGALPPELMDLARTLGVPVVEGVSPK